ncbi:MAG: AmmeMemoRadiSam system protein B [Gammaproteobacteria bacterium]|nr:AmmeMemoRadiSam system protein B [Gammaproteobacteria bacterium]
MTPVHTAAQTTIRPPAVAGMFYPADRQQLHDDVTDYLASAVATRPNAPVPKAIIAPHAGYVYSGPVAASAYARLLPARDRIHRVILLGPSHRVPFRGLASSSADAFTTPLGQIRLDRAAIDSLADLPQVQRLDAAHAQEHSLEVHLPFLQEVLDDFQLVPLVVGDASPAEVAAVLERLWGGPETLIVISSDLSHYHDYTTARRLDRHTSNAIEGLRAEAVHSEDACGCVPVAGLLYLAREHGLQASTIDLRNSGDTAGPRDRVVGYGAYVFN